MSEYKKIHIVSRQEWLDVEAKRHKWLEDNYPKNLQATVDSHNARMKQREDIIAKFPYSVILTGSYPEHDYVARWGWQNIGPMDCKECHEHYSEYPGCQLVLATEYIEKGSYPDKDGKVIEWEEKAYKEAEAKHGHEGEWTAFWLGKTGYDYGSSEYCFLKESDRDRFLAAAPTFNFGEKYEKEGV